MRAAARFCFEGVIAALTSCSPLPHLEVHPSQISIPEQIDRAKLIVMGVIEDDSPIRIYKRENSVLCAMRIRVEGVLEGQYNKEELTFYYYMPAGPYSSPPLNMPNTPGDRGVFYLVSEKGVLRATTDWYLSHTLLQTGRHDISPAINKAEIREKVASLLLVPGDEADYDGFLYRIDDNVFLALELVPHTRVIEILQSLVRHPDPEVRGKACLILAKPLFNENGCLPGLVNDTQAMIEDRRRAEELMEKIPGTPSSSVPESSTAGRKKGKN